MYYFYMHTHEKVQFPRNTLCWSTNFETTVCSEKKISIDNRCHKSYYRTPNKPLSTFVASLHVARDPKTTYKISDFRSLYAFYEWKIRTTRGNLDKKKSKMTVCNSKTFTNIVTTIIVLCDKNERKLTWPEFLNVPFLHSYSWKEWFSWKTLSDFETTVCGEKNFSVDNWWQTWTSKTLFVAYVVSLMWYANLRTAYNNLDFALYESTKSVLSA